jgi:hypothetical protein
LVSHSRHNLNVDEPGELTPLNYLQWLHDRDVRDRRRRTDVLALPMVRLRVHGQLRAPDSLAGSPLPATVGVSSEALALAAWPAAGDRGGILVTSHSGSGQISPRLELATSLPARPNRFVQPLPDGRTLLVADCNRGRDNAEIWTADGRLERTISAGDAVQEALSTAAGAVWIGYFDEAMKGFGPDGQPGRPGLARFSSTMELEWVYPYDAVPLLDDCEALNVAGETAYCCAYAEFHLISVTGNLTHDHGPAPVRGAEMLLVDADRAALIGGYGAEYDLITPVRITKDGVERAGRPGRLMLPDGQEIPGGPLRMRTACRGPDLHMFSRSGTWYRLALDDLAAT